MLEVSFEVLLKRLLFTSKPPKPSSNLYLDSHNPRHNCRLLLFKEQLVIEICIRIDDDAKMTNLRGMTACPSKVKPLIMPTHSITSCSQGRRHYQFKIYHRISAQTLELESNNVEEHFDSGRFGQLSR